MILLLRKAIRINIRIINYLITSIFINRVNKNDSINFRHLPNCKKYKILK